MLKIIALNDDGKDGYNVDDELVATREAQESIAESEYLRAIKLKSAGKVDECLHLLEKLLQTKVLNEDIKRDRNDKLWVIKYNCHKNIAVILEERFKYILSLQHYIAAILIDNTDVFTMHKFGQLSLKLNATELAEYAFENCIVRNSAHWNAAEGMLNVMGSYDNIIGLFIWAKKIFDQNNNNTKAKEILKELSILFNKNVLFFKQCDGMKTIPLFDTQQNFSSKILFGEKQLKAKGEKHLLNEVMDIQKFSFKRQNWISVGQFIINVYSNLCDGNSPFFFVFDFNDIVVNSHIDNNSKNKNTSMTDPDSSILHTGVVEIERNVTCSNDILTEQSKPTITEKSETYSLDCHNYDSDSNAKSDGGDTTKTKPRRRCSDLHFLEQWGWHKSRRYSSRKKTDRDDLDTSLNGYLRKILIKYIFTTIDEKWPFNEKCENFVDVEIQCKECRIDISEENFEDITKKEFDMFLNKLKKKRIDLIEVIYKWLKYISFAWSVPMPNNIKACYVEIFEIYMLHFNLSAWNQLTPSNYESSLRICILYLELSIQKHLNNNSELWHTVFNHILSTIGNCCLISGRYKDIYILRVIYLEYILHNNNQRLEDCISCLENILYILSRKPPFFKLHLPNLNKVCVNMTCIQELQLMIKRQIDVNKIPTLYKENAWDHLVDIITANIKMSKNNFDDINWLKDVCVQVKILLQSFWQKASYDCCLAWSEKSLHYAASYYMEEPKATIRAILLADLINFITSYIEAIILNEGFHIVSSLKKEDLSRLVQNIIRILVYQFDGSFEKNSMHGQELNYKRCWVILHQLILKQENSPNELNTGGDDIEDVNELIPSSFLILFTAHEYLGRRQWCTNDNGEFLQYVLDAVVFNLKAPIFDVCRDIIYEHLEQVTYCLFKFPPKKARSRHLEDHEATQIKLSWSKAVQVFDLYRPIELPEFNSYKLDSITSDMEQLLLKIILLIPKDLDPSTSVHHVTNFIEGRCELPPTEVTAFKMPYKILSLFYLLADFYFKTRDFQKAIKFYTLDLSVNPTRFDSWAGMALSKASKIETKINGLDLISAESIWEECEEVLRCFECCINLNRFQTLLWIEYGSFSYTIHSYFSRYIKRNLHNLSSDAISTTEERKNKMLTIAFNCFSLANSLQNSVTTNNNEDNTDDNANDEKWLCQYMLGKISEKRKEEPKIYLNHYLLAANYLYENSATYPIKINHSNPTTLSVEALEVFYRINAAIIKYLHYGKGLTRCTANFFNRILIDLSNSPFAYNKAKIDGNSLNILKGKLIKKYKKSYNYVEKPSLQTITIKEQKFTTHENIAENMESLGVKKACEQLQTKHSQEAINTLNSTTNTTTPSAMSSDNSTVESESDSEESITENKRIISSNGDCLAEEELKTIYGMVIRNIEECATRFPEHYKSVYRLVYHYMNSPKEYLDLSQSEKLLLGQYKTSFGNLVNGLFYDRKNNNLFNGIWRIPSSEIDRPGSFSAHLVKCVKIFIQLLDKTNNYTILVDLAMNLYKTPDLDKRYITDAERNELCKESIRCCIKILRSILQKNESARNDLETLNLLIDVYKIHKKCIKYMSKKEPVFAELLIDVYKFFISDKVDYFPEDCNFLDLAIKLCVQEITVQKNTERATHSDTLASTSDFNVNESSNLNQTSGMRSFHIPGLLTRTRFRPTATKNLETFSFTTQAQDSFNIPLPDIMQRQHLMYMLKFFGSGNRSAETDDAKLENLSEQYAKIVKNEKEVLLNSTSTTLKSINQLSDLTIVNKSISSVMLTLPNTKTTTDIRVSGLPGNCSAVKKEEIVSSLSADTVISNQLDPKSLNKIKKNIKPLKRVIDYNHETTLTDFNLPQKKAFSNLQNDDSKYLGLAKKPRVQYPDVQYDNQLSIASLPFNNLSNMSPAKQTSESYENSILSLISFPRFGLHQQSESSGSVPSPMKTLQEKLAERQKANQLNENYFSNKTTKEDNNEDVIVLD